MSKYVPYDGQAVAEFRVLPEELRRRAVDPKNPACPFHSFVGNRDAVKRLSLLAYTALGDEYHKCKQSFALLGPASTGKTTLAKMFAKMIGLPFIEIHPQSVKNPTDVVVSIGKVLENFKVKLTEDTHTTLELIPDDKGDVIVPPCVVFIDEAHNLRNAVVQGLLKAIEPNDATLILDTGYKVDTELITWIIATTDRGMLFDAFDTRFMKINLHPYTRKEITKILKLSHPEWPDEVCQLAAKYGGQVVREAKQFAEEMANYAAMHRDKSLKEVAIDVAKMNGIDDFGLSYKRLSVLQVLGSRGPLSRVNLAQAVQIKEEELEKFVLPPLKASTSDQDTRVVACSKGYAITLAGLEELDKRGIGHMGMDAIPEVLRKNRGNRLSGENGLWTSNN